MKRLILIATSFLLCLSVTAQEEKPIRWYHHFYVNDYVGLSVPMSSTLQTGYAIDLAGEYHLQMEDPFKGWAIGLRMNERSYSYTRQTIEESTLISANVEMTDFIAGILYRLHPLKKCSIAFSAYGGLTMCRFPTVNAVNEQIILTRFLPLAHAECAFEWYFYNYTGLSFSIGYTQHLVCSPFSPDPPHDGYLQVSLGLVSSFL